MNWQLKSFEELTNQQLYQILKLRCDVFIVEQNCAYPDLDDLDNQSGCLHLMAFATDDTNGTGQETLVAYARLLAPNMSYTNMSSIGRVIVSPSHRAAKLGHTLITQAVKYTKHYWPTVDIKIGAQAHLQNFYQQHDFQVISKPYIEDGIPHIHMLYKV